MEELSKAKKRDSFINIMFAMMIGDDKKEQQHIKISEIQNMINKIISLRESLKDREKDKYSYIKEYDMPDLSINAIKNNKHVENIDLDDDIAFRMGAKEAARIIIRNPELVRLITNFAYIDSFNEDLMGLTDNTIVFDCHNPNDEYLLGYVYTGNEQKENKLVTDGIIKIVEQNEFSKKVKVERASYVIFSSYENNALLAAVVKADILHPTFLTFLMFEARDFYMNQLGNYDCSEDKPSVLRKRLN